MTGEHCVELEVNFGLVLKSGKVVVDDFLVDVNYCLSGAYVPQTYWQPAEEPELEVFQVTLDGVDVTDDIYSMKPLEEAVWGHLDKFSDEYEGE